MALGYGDPEGVLGLSIPETRASPFAPCHNCACTPCACGVRSIDWKPEELGLKHDAHKSRYDLIPPDALDAIAQVLTEGAAKYSPRGWEKGTSWGRYFAACMRHLWAWWRGERLDPESALPHLAHAACCIMFLLAYEARGVGEDDRTGSAEAPPEKVPGPPDYPRPVG